MLSEEGRDESRHVGVAEKRSDREPYKQQGYQHQDSDEKPRIYLITPFFIHDMSKLRAGLPLNKL